MPSAPNSSDFDVSTTVSAFALMENFLYSSHQVIRVLNSSESSADSISISPTKISPVEPSIDIKSPSSSVRLEFEIVLFL